MANLWVSALGNDSGYVDGLLGPMLLVGMGAGLTFMPITVAVLSDVEPAHAGSASGLLQMSQQVGGSLGLAVLVTVYASHTVPGDVVAGMRQSFETGAGFLALGVLVALVMLRRPRPEGDRGSHRGRRARARGLTHAGRAARRTYGAMGGSSSFSAGAGGRLLGIGRGLLGLGRLSLVARGSRRAPARRSA